MRFLITMNMPSNNGKLVHQVIGEHDAKSLAEFIDHLVPDELLIVQEYYFREGALEESGMTAINPRHIGKVQQWRDREGGR